MEVEALKKIKIQYKEWKTKFVFHMSGFVYRMYKELLQLNNKRTTQFKNWKNI